MVSRRAIAISLTLFACSAKANNLCSLKRAPADKVIKIGGVPGFFFKVHPDGDYLTLIETEHNTLLDLHTGKELPTVGSIDPVWSPDGKFLTHPGGNDEQAEGKNPEEAQEPGLWFYPGDQILDATLKGKHKEMKPQKSQLGGVYQSIGVKGDDYKIISDKDGVSMAEYKYSKNGGPEQTSEIYKPCSNFPSMGTDLPMLSKDGRYLAVYESSQNSTRIYKLNGKECDLALDLGFGTGKVSFNSDSSQIAFHVDQFTEFENGYFSGVGKDKIKNVVVLNLDEDSSGKLTPSSWAMASHNAKPGDGSYYPDFDKHGNVYYMEDIENNFQIVKVAPKSLEFRPMEKDLLFGKQHCVSCEGQRKEITPTDVLAKLWTDICKGENNIPLNHYRELVMGIDPVACKEMVEKFYVASLGIAKEKLLETCPSGNHKDPHLVGEWDPNQKNAAETAIKAKCVSCHKGTKTYESTESLSVMTGPQTWEEEEITIKKKMGPINLDNLDFKTAAMMMNSIMEGSMPKKEPLGEKERKNIVNYLQKRMLDMKQEYTNDFLNVRRYTEEHLEVERQNILKQMPNATREQKQVMIHTVNCIYGQKNCTEYIASQMTYINSQAESFPAEKRQLFIDDRVMSLKCSNLFEVSPQECVDWDAKRPAEFRGY